MARPEKQRSQTLDEAVAQLKRDPSHPVRARVDNLDVELRAVPSDQGQEPAEDVMCGAGPWQGESTEELLRIIHEGRKLDEPPPLRRP